jgi:tRNA splicing ligase
MSGLARRLYRREVTARLNQIRDEQAREAVRYDAGQARLASVGVAQLPDRTTTTDGDSSQSLA